MSNSASAVPVTTGSLPLDESFSTSSGGPPLVTAGVASTPINLEYYQHELGFWRQETIRLRKQVEELSSQTSRTNEADSPVVVPSPVEAEPQATVSASNPRLNDVALSTLFARVTSDPALERKVSRLLRVVTYFVVLILFAWRVLLEGPFLLLLPSVGFALFYFSSSIFRL
jgi:hypothetical protein